MITDYCTAAELKADLGVGDSADDLSITSAISAASREIDGHCGRSFWQDTTVVTREFYAASPTCLDLLDQPGEQPAREISTTTGLIVKTDEAGTGTFGTTLTISTDFLVSPRNAVADGIAISQLDLVDNFNFPRASNGRAGVQITAKFGWPSIPDDVNKACRIQAAQLFKAKDAAFGVVSFGDAGALRVGSKRLHPVAAGLLERYQIVPVG